MSIIYCGSLEHTHEWRTLNNEIESLRAELARTADALAGLRETHARAWLKIDDVRAELARRDEQIADAWDGGFKAGRKYQAELDDWYDDEELDESPQRPTNPYRETADG